MSDPPSPAETDTTRAPGAEPQRGKRLLLGALGVGALGAGAAVALWQYGPDAASDPAVDLLFAQSFPDVAGQEIALSQYRGKVLVVNFWATWCPPCVEEMPELSAIQSAMHMRGVQMLGLAVDSADRVRDFSRRMPVDYPLLIVDAAGFSLGSELGNDSGALPYTVVISRDGRLIERKLGRIKREILVGQIEAALRS